MPVVRSSKSRIPSTDVKGALVAQLVKELLGEGGRGGPVIFEVPTKNPATIDVIVVWDSWMGISPSDRSDTIRSAYKRHAELLEENVRPVDRPDVAECRHKQSAAMAFGATTIEAINDRLLPYRIIGTGRGRGIVRHAMIEEGAIEIPGLTDGLFLGFPSREMADEAFERMVATYPQGHWEKHYF